MTLSCRYASFAVTSPGQRSIFIQMDSLLDASGFAHYAGQFVAVVGIASVLAYLVGRPDTARQRGAQVISFARDSQSSYDAAFARHMQSWLYADLRDPQGA